jgi:hypothetical protein
MSNPASLKKRHNESNVVYQYFINVYGVILTISSHSDTIELTNVKDIIADRMGIHQQKQNYKTLGGIILKGNLLIYHNDNCNLVLYQPGKGGGKDDKRLTAEQVHPNKKCGPCFICNKLKDRYTHLMQRDHDFIIDAKAQHSTILDSSCICKTCEMQIRRYKTSLNVERNVAAKKQRLSCCLAMYNQCTEPEDGIRSVMLSRDDFQKCFSISSDAVQPGQFKKELETVMLCNIHRCLAHNYSRLKTCSFCHSQTYTSNEKNMKNFTAAMLPYAVDYFSKLNQVERVNTADKCCQNCYFAVFNFMRKEKLVVQARNKICTILDSVKTVEMCSVTADVYGLNKSIEYLCQHFLNKIAVLLSSVYTVYLENVEQYQVWLRSSCDDCEIFLQNIKRSDRWLLDNMSRVFQDELVISKTANNNLGTLLRNKGFDNVSALHQAMYDLKETVVHIDNPPPIQCNTKTASTDSLKTDVTDTDILKSAVNILREQIFTMMDMPEQNITVDHTHIDYTQWVFQSCTPAVWNFFFSLTQSKWSKTKASNINWQNHSIENDNKNDSYLKSKVMRRLFLICCCMFNINDKCQQPLHVVIADTLDKYTNSSSDCLQIMNSFGICVSKDTLLRFQVQKAEETLLNGPNISKHAFAIASADNINKRSSYAAVRAASTGRGFDGTSVQIVQPKPKTLHWHPDDKCDFMKSTVSSKNGTLFHCISLPGPLSFYRCIIASLHSSLKQCPRDLNGYPSDEGLLSLENMLVTKLHSVIGDCLVCRVQDSTNVPDFEEFIALSALSGSSILVYNDDPSHPGYITVLQENSIDFASKHSFKLYITTQNELTTFNCLLSMDDYSCEKQLLTFSVEDCLKNLKSNNNIVEPTDVLFERAFQSYFRAPTTVMQSCIKSSTKKQRSIEHAILDKHSVKALQSKNPNIFPSDSVPNKNVPFCISDFEPRESEIEQVTFLRNSLFTYCVGKFITSETEHSLPGIQASMAGQHDPTTEKAHVIYLSILDENADSKETIQLVLDQLYTTMGIGTLIKHLLVVGDGKTYDHLIKLKEQYGSALSWLLPYPGDWHILKNYQGILMKLFGDAGLQDLVDLYHKGATAQCVNEAKSFDKTHSFLCHVWEAMFRYEIEKFYEMRSEYFATSPTSDILSFDHISAIICGDIDSKQNNTQWTKTLGNIQNLYKKIENLQKEFDEFNKIMCRTNETWKFWHDFIHIHCFLYIAGYLAIRSGNWDLRCYCIKHFARITQITHSTYYNRLLPQHIADMLTYPDSILSHFKKGGFVMNVQGHNWHSQAFDEGHESCINKDVKMSMTSTSTASLAKLVNYFPYRGQALKNLKMQLGLSEKNYEYAVSTKFIMLEEENVKTLIRRLQDSLLFETSGLGGSTHPFLRHIFTGQEATVVQRGDMTNYLNNANTLYTDYVHCKYIVKSRSKIVKRIKNLNTFSVKKRTVSTVKKELKDQQLETRMLKAQLSWASQNQVVPGDIQQSILLPRAIATADGTLFKGDKAKTMHIFKNRYPSAFTEGSLLTFFQPDCVIIDGMFILYNTAPVKSQKTFSDYISYLFKHWLLPQYLEGVNEVHIVFDDQFNSQPSPKQFERDKRDVNAAGVTSRVLEHASIPRNWNTFLQVRENKQNIVGLISDTFLKIAIQVLTPSQSLIIGGGFTNGIAKIAQNKVLQESPSLVSNIQEGDSLVWLHGIKSQCKNILIYSPDTDTTHIGLSVAARHNDKKFVVMLRRCAYNSQYIDINTLLQSLQNDIDLQGLLVDNIVRVFQMLYISTGCDYVSFFKDHGKKSFYKTFYKYSGFICGLADHTLGSLCDYHTSGMQEGFLSFVRLIGCEYFSKCVTTFLSICPDGNPGSLYATTYNGDANMYENHNVWLNKIREAVTVLTPSEEYYIPSITSLKYHWQRACWVAQVWGQADLNYVAYPPLSDHGWGVADDNRLSIVWDSEEHMTKVDNFRKLWTQGCHCVKARCGNNQCGCKHENKFCGPLCKCGAGCVNTGVATGTAVDVVGFDSLDQSQTGNISSEGNSSDEDIPEE